MILSALAPVPARCCSPGAAFAKEALIFPGRATKKVVPKRRWRAAMPENPAIDETERRIINHLQGGFPLCEQPFAQVADELGLSEEELIRRIESLLARQAVTRFGPMFNADRLGGAFCLCAMAIPPEHFEEVAQIVNAHKEVAHNYEREHELNMWFVLAAESEGAIERTLGAIERETGIHVETFPKLDEYFIGLRMEL
jgi:DNA-binding Lrp family transcriptional regulator